MHFVLCSNVFTMLFPKLKLKSDCIFSCRPPESVPVRGEEKKKPRPKDVFGRTLPTEEEFEVLKNAPRYVWICSVPVIKRKSDMFNVAKLTRLLFGIIHES